MKRNRTRIAVTIVLCSLALCYMALLTALNLHRTEQVVMRQTQQHVLGAARAKAEHLSDLVRTLDSELRAFASGPVARSAVTGESSSSRNGAVPGLWPNSPLVRLSRRVTILDSDGRITWDTETSEWPSRADGPLRHATHAILQGAPLYIGPVGAASDTGDEQTFVYAVPVVLDDRVRGTAAASVSTTALAGHLKDVFAPGLAQLWLFDENGQVVVHPDAKWIGRSVFVLQLHDLGTEAAMQHAVAEMLSGCEGVTAPVTNRKTGRHSMVAWSPVIVGNEQWALAVCLDYDRQVAGPMRIQAQNTFMMLGCFAIAILAGAFVYYRLARHDAYLRTQRVLGRVTDELQDLNQERERWVDDLRGQVNRLRQVFAALPWPVYWTDAQGVFQGCNEAFAKRLGLRRPEDIIGMRGADLRAGHPDRTLLLEGDDEVRRTGIGLLNLERSTTSAEGRPTRILVNKVPLRQAGHVVGLVTCYVELDGAAAGGTEEEARGVTPPQNNPPRQASGPAQQPSDRVRHADGPDTTIPPSSHSAQSQTPICKASEQEHPGKAASRPQAGEATGSVLIVDDVPENCILLETVLRKAGYRTQSCSDGRQAVAAAKEEAFDVILMDIMMPTLDGLRALEAIRSSGPNRETTILAVTASLDRTEQQACLEAGFDDCIRKPIKVDLVLRKVRRAVQRKRQQQQAAEGQPIVSFLADDPDYTKTVETFVTALPERLRQFQEDFERGALRELALKLHAFKGVGGLTGFPVLSEKAERLEELIDNEQIEQLGHELDELVQLCRRTRLTYS